MINLADVTSINKQMHNPKWPQIPDHSYRILKIGGFQSWKIYAYIPIRRQPDIDKIFLSAKNSYEPKYQLLINKCK